MTPPRVSFTWSTRRDGNDGYVLETGPEGHRAEYGPMPPHIVPAFVQGRRRIVAMQAQRHGASYVEPTHDYRYLLDPSAERKS
jgi:hypothetical protein